jgi:hypothetical protein
MLVLSVAASSPRQGPSVPLKHPDYVAELQASSTFLSLLSSVLRTWAAERRPATTARRTRAHLDRGDDFCPQPLFVEGHQRIGGYETAIGKPPPEPDRRVVLIVALDLEEERGLDAVALAPELVTAQEDEGACQRPELGTEVSVSALREAPRSARRVRGLGRRLAGGRRPALRATRQGGDRRLLAGPLRGVAGRECH